MIVAYVSFEPVPPREAPSGISRIKDSGAQRSLVQFFLVSSDMEVVRDQTLVKHQAGKSNLCIIGQKIRCGSYGEEELAFRIEGREQRTENPNSNSNSNRA